MSTVRASGGHSCILTVDVATRRSVADTTSVCGTSPLFERSGFGRQSSAIDGPLSGDRGRSSVLGKHAARVDQGTSASAEAHEQAKGSFGARRSKSARGTAGLGFEIGGA